MAGLYSTETESNLVLFNCIRTHSVLPTRNEFTCYFNKPLEIQLKKGKVNSNLHRGDITICNFEFIKNIDSKQQLFVANLPLHCHIHFDINSPNGYFRTTTTQFVFKMRSGYHQRKDTVYRTINKKKVPIIVYNGFISNNDSIEFIHLEIIDSYSIKSSTIVEPSSDIFNTIPNYNVSKYEENEIVDYDTIDCDVIDYDDESFNYDADNCETTTNSQSVPPYTPIHSEPMQCIEEIDEALINQKIDLLLHECNLTYSNTS